MDKENIYYVYEYYIVDTDEVIYVGKGKDKRYKDTKHRNKFFKDMYSTHNCYVRIIYNNLSETEAFEKEKQLIELYKNTKPEYRLTNQTDGGEGISGYKHTEEYKLKYSKMLKGENNPNYNNKWSDEQKRNLSIKRKINKKSKGINNPKSKSVMCIETGKIYEYMRLAIEEYKMETDGLLSIALDHEYRTAKDLHWVTITDKNKEYWLDKDNRFNYLITRLLSNNHIKPLICIENKEIYESRSKLAKIKNVTDAYIKWHLNKNKYVDIDGLTYEYLSDYSRTC